MALRQVISVLTENHQGALCRIAGLIFRRGYDVESLSVRRIGKTGISRFTIVFNGDDESARQIMSQLKKLIEVIDVDILNRDKSSALTVGDF